MTTQTACDHKDRGAYRSTWDKTWRCMACHQPTQPPPDPPKRSHLRRVK